MSLIDNVIATRERIIHVLVFLVSIIVVAYGLNSGIQYIHGCASTIVHTFPLTMCLSVVLLLGPHPS
jgi:hypothetical protein